MSLSRMKWEDLPMTVRRAVEAHTGPVTAASTTSGGFNSAIAATLHTRSGPVFCKGLPMDHRQIVTQRREREINPHVVGLSPRLLWHVEVDGWDLSGFEHINGRHADYRPGSDDLRLIVECLQRLQQVECPDLPLKQAEQRLRGYVTEPAEAEMFAGDALLHTDWNCANLLIKGRAYLVDWAWATRGAAWLDPAGWLVWLMAEGGHTAAQAEAWAGRIPSWPAAPADAVAAYAKANARLWAEIAQGRPDEWTSRTASAAGAWALYRAQQDQARVGC
ncbi:aminoglycoside phosphotransferase [Parafrankia sp. BMG5.11]|uniref:aminoglycoside phosphotransferase n=1 Tax=Parafrankia sp. BMG5.11 TaxID=222540 RepID=UPI00103F63C7|nr:aminoglycoside phosphotransferase [Parafrankia sp. BMG5.11]TCJ34622.1 aminoglycoside phosphotransferase [Parafrankia sp. BMG5.11]